MYTNFSGMPPFAYDTINYYTCQQSPSTLHCRNTALQAYFAKYLLQKAISVFRWEIPETWETNYFLYTLYGWGFVAVFNTDKYGIIPQGCGISGYNIMYQPTTAIITNPLFNRTYELRIGQQCEILKLEPDYSSIMDIIMYYADAMAIISESITQNVANSKLSYMFSASNKSGAESLKKIMDKVMSGETAVFYDSSINMENGGVPWFPFSQNLKQNFIAPDLVAVLKQLEAMFDTEIGIPNANTDKKERLITDEVMSNRISTFSKCELWLEELKKGCEKIRKMFGIKLAVDWRNDPSKLQGSVPQKEGGNDE